jgi:CRP-like cAMP-binding protein
MSTQLTGNRLLDSLSKKDLGLLFPHLEGISLAVRDPINARAKPIDFVYFPTAGMVSMVATLANGSQVEVGIVGSEGMVGGSVIMGTDTASNEAFVQIAGSALRLRSNILVRRAIESRSLRERFLLFALALTFQISQTAACNVRHNVVERLARWLLMAQERVAGDDLPLTQEFLAMMLGVRRAGVTVAAGTLQAGGLIRYNHGRVVVLDRRGLEAAACECYRVGRKESARLLG